MPIDKKAREYASRVHLDDVYGDGSYLEKHLDAVAKILEEVVEEGIITISVPLVTLKAVAYLHATIEDHPDQVSREDLRKEFGPWVAEAVHVLTQTDEDADYSEYIVRILQQPDTTAALVKLADLGADLEACLASDQPEPARIVKYKLAALLITLFLKRKRNNG